MKTKTALLHLQEIDITQAKIRRRLLKLQKLVSGPDEVKAAREKVAALESELHTWQGTQTDAELEARSLTSRIEEAETHLMSGQVRNPKELESLQASVESMKRHRSTIEDRSVEALIQIDELQQRLGEKRSQLETLEADWQTRMASIEAEIEKRKKEYVYLKRLREQVVAPLAEDVLEQYEGLRQRKNGVAVARLENDVCGACHTQVATGILSNIRYRDALVYCPTCGRILVAEE